MDKNHAFTLIKEQEMPEAGGLVRLWKHNATGAQVLSVSNKDENKCFGVTLRTPPSDSTGVAHILEHSVLCGSDKYPVKEPFVELLKGSLQTFLNAFTFPDKTCYPVASANLQDFYNLIDVYLDAVFHPRISADIFRQEGWHIEAESTNAQWTYKGVVYNEMKGVYSSPDSLLAEKSQQSLFPDMLYSLDSGGNPEVIPNLTYEQFVTFHRLYYHPSNARFFFWGDDPEERRLELLANVLQPYTYQAVNSEIPLQKKLITPRLLESPYPASAEEKRAMFTINWLLGERGNVREALRMEMLEHILEGLPGSPLRRALIASGLGEDTTGGGLETDLRQMFYSTGLKGIHPADLSKAETLIFDTLADLVDKGLDPADIEAAVNSVEFAYRESNSGRFPQGLSAMLQALSTWLYDGDPFAALAWEQPLQEIKEALAHGEKIFENLIRTNFLDNKHRSTVVLLPDATLEQQRTEREEARLASVYAKASSSEREQIIETTQRLQQAQTSPDTPENLATIPSLSVQDLPTRNPFIPRTESYLPQVCLNHDLPTRGIAYLHFLFPLDFVPKRLLPLLPIFARTLTELGTAKRDFSALGAYIAAKTGGVGASLLTGTKARSRQTFAYLILSGKAVYDKIPELFAILDEILLQPLQDTNVICERLGQILLESRARMEQVLRSAGHATVSTRLSAHFNSAGAFSELTGGLSYLDALYELTARMDKNPQSLLDDLEELRKAIVSSRQAVFDCTAEASGLALANREAEQLLRALPSQPLVSTQDKLKLPPLQTLPLAEALIVPSSVNFVGAGINLYDLGWTYHGSAGVILRYLRMGYLWEQIRVLGGAYGAFCKLDRLSGTLLCSSYRDPNVESTLQAFSSGMSSFLHTFAPDKTQLAQAIIGAVGDLDTYLLPDAKGSHSLACWLNEDTEEDRQQLREEMLSTTAQHFRAFADVLAHVKEGAICVLGGQNVEKVATQRDWAMRNLLQTGGTK